MTISTPTAPHIYIQSDVPEGMTLVDWRRAHSAPRRRRLHRPGFQRSTS